MIRIDGSTYDVGVKVLGRKADMLYKYAERVESGTLQSELIGVYYNYELECGMSDRSPSDYAALWQKITEPVTSHTIIMPDESGELSFSCYFANISDGIVNVNDEGVRSKGLRFSVIAISPARTP